MEDKNYTGIVPEQYTGKDIKAEAAITFENISEAQSAYDAGRKKLLNVNDWHHVAGIVSAHFQVCDSSGNELQRSVGKGDYIRIDIPGPGSSAGDGYDWVVVETVKEIAEPGLQSVGFRVRPAPDPGSDSKNIAHFYEATATSSFIVTREGTTLTASIIDHNTQPNDEGDSLMDKVRHLTVGTSALALFSKMQWNNLAKGILKAVN
jgi:hypothetical protein